MRYGFRRSGATGCGWVATHNALRLMGYPSSPGRLIRYYQWQFPIINGNFGTLLPGIVLFFRQRGFLTKCILSPRKFDRALKDSDVGILFYYWRRKKRLGAHFVTVRYQDGRFEGYNTFVNSDGPDDYGISLEIFLKRRKYFFPVLITLKDRR